MYDGYYSTSLNAMAKEIRKINEDNGWRPFQMDEWNTEDYKVPAILMLINSELAEALEAFRKGDWGNFLEELADVQIRLLDLAGGCGVDFDEAVLAKMDKNRGRGHRHGGKRV